MDLIHVECKNKWCEINIKTLIRIKHNDFTL